MSRSETPATAIPFHNRAASSVPEYLLAGQRYDLGTPRYSWGKRKARYAGIGFA